MSTFSEQRSKRWSENFFNGSERIVQRSGQGESEASAKFSTEETIRGSYALTAILILLLLVRKAVARADRDERWMTQKDKSVTVEAVKSATRVQLEEVVAVAVTDISPPLISTPTLTSSPPCTGMITKLACYPPNILFCVPYLLTFLHVTTSTAIRAVDDNQSIL